MVVSHAHADQEFWEIDRDLAKELSVDVATLEEKLGVEDRKSTRLNSSHT